jgi:hypothetical protein
LTLVNLTTESIVYHSSLNGNFDLPITELSLGVKTRTRIRLPKGAQVELSRSLPKSDIDWSKECTIHSAVTSLRIPLALSTLCKVISVPDRCPWQIYLSRVSRWTHLLHKTPSLDLSLGLSNTSQTHNSSQTEPIFIFDRYA